MQLVKNRESGVIHRPETGTVARPGHMFTGNGFSWCGNQIDDPDGPYDAVELDPYTTPERLCKICFHVMP